MDAEPGGLMEPEMKPPHHEEPPPPEIERVGEDGVAYVEKSTRGSWEDYQRSRSHPQSFDLLLGALSILLMWLAVITAAVSLVLRWTGVAGPWGTVGVAALVVLVVSLISSLVYSMNRRCPLCHGTPLHSRRCRKHRLADRWPGLTHRFTTVLRIVTSLNFRCMYCGTPFRLFKKSSRNARRG